jgi:hypothetical protein
MLSPTDPLSIPYYNPILNSTLQTVLNNLIRFITLLVCVEWAYSLAHV